MTDVVIAASQADARAAEAVEQHHAQMSGTLSALVERLVSAAGRSDSTGATEARERLAEWCEHELLPHASAEEQSLYPAARDTAEGRLLVDSMVSEHQVIGGLVRALAAADDPVRAAADARALRVLFQSHLAKENDVVLPLLLRTPGVSVAGLLGGMHALLGDRAHDAHQPHHAGDSQGADEANGMTSGCADGHTCSCGETAPAGYPELDARSIPHAIRHATIFGAREAGQRGGGLVLVAPHDPMPLLTQVGDRWPGRFSVDYLDRGPETWRLTLVRSAV
jgi:uncharacterized protein (DUF2249 family)/iron-sulfur cluster repair protein YtfE (RIC family)